MNTEDTQRMLEAFAYIAENSPKTNEYNVLKVFYLADKLHMERYGRFIFDDSYAALDLGPVPSHAYDLIKLVRTKGQLPSNTASPVEIQSGHKVTAIRAADLDLFSPSDLECIDEILLLAGSKDLGELSHDKAWEETHGKSHFIAKETIINSLSNSEDIMELVANRHP